MRIDATIIRITASALALRTPIALTAAIGVLSAQARFQLLAGSFSNSLRASSASPNFSQYSALLICIGIFAWDTAKLLQPNSKANFWLLSRFYSGRSGKGAVDESRKRGRFKSWSFVIHDYFFAAALEKVRSGGLILFITSRGTLDKVDAALREYLSQQADLLGAIRLTHRPPSIKARASPIDQLLAPRRCFGPQNSSSQRTPKRTPNGSDGVRLSSSGVRENSVEKGEEWARVQP